MAFERAFININIAVDLDSVAGNFDKAEDFVTFIEQTIKKAIPHYKPEVTLKGFATKPYVWNEDSMEYSQPKLVDDPRKPKVGDRAFSLEDGANLITEIREGEDGIPFVIINEEMEGGSESCIDYLAFNLLTWNESENRWEYGDLERK